MKKEPKARSQEPENTRRTARAFLFWLLASGFWLLVSFPSPALSAPTSTDQVYVRDSAVVTEKFALAQRMERLHEWNKASDVYQEILSGFSDRVMPIKQDADNHTIQYGGVVASVQERLSHWPADGIAAYRARFDVEAQSLLNSAKPDDLATLDKVFSTYFITEAGRSAGTKLIDCQIEAGEFAAASWTAQRMLDLHPDLADERPLLLYRAALAYHLCGNETRAQDRLAELEKASPAALGHVRGQDVVLLDALRAILSTPSPKAASVEATDSWPLTFGSADRARVASSTSKVGARLFPVELGRGDPTMLRNDASQLEAANDVDRFAGYYTGVFPAVDRGELYFQDGARLYAVSLESGLPLPGWVQTYEGEKNGAYTAPGCSPMARGHVMAVTLTDDSALAIMGMSDARMVAMTGELDLIHNTRLVCLDRATGRERWTRRPAQLAEGSPPNLAHALKDLDLIGSPLVVGENIYIQARGGKGLQFEDSYVLCINLAGGKLNWATYVASANVSGPDEYTAITPQSVSYLAYSNGRIFCLTNLGAVASIGAYDGSIVWLNVYPREGPRKLWPQIQQAPAQKPYIYNPVIVSDQNVFILPNDGTNLHVYNAADGAEIKRIPLSLSWKSEDADKPYERIREQMNMLIGVIDGKIVASSDHYLMMFDWNKLDPQNTKQTVTWLQPLPDDRRTGRAGNPNIDLRIVGRPFLAGDVVLVPRPSKLQAISTRSGGVVYNYPTSQHWGDDEGPGNVLAVGEYLIVAGPTRLTVYTDRDLAIKRLDLAVNAAPNDPQPRLRYAEVMFVSNDLNLAMTKLDEAIALLGGRQSLAPGAVRERLFADLLTFARKLTKNSGDENTEVINGLYDRAIDAAQTPAQQVNVRLSRAEFARAKHDIATEMRLDQEILLQPNWRDLMIARGDANGARPAGMIATESIDELLSRPDGIGFFSPFEKQANDLLDANRASSDPDKLLEIARSYPNATASRQAMSLAADLYEASGNPRQAVQVLRQLYTREQNSPDKIRITEALARNYLAMPNRLDVAAARLALVAKLPNQPKLSRPMRLPDGQILRDVTFADALDAVRKLQSHAAISALPDLRLPTATSAKTFAPIAPVIDGIAALCIPSRQFSRTDRIVAFSSASGLCVFVPGADKPMYSSNAIAEAPRGVAWIGGNLLAWTSDSITMLDGESGATVWQIPIASLPSPDAISLDSQDQASNDADNAIVNGPDANGAIVVDGPEIRIAGGQRVIIRGGGQIVVNGRMIQQQRILVQGRILRRGGMQIMPQPVPAPAAPPVFDPAKGEQIVAVAPLNDRAIIATSTGRIASIELTEGTVQWQSRPARAPVTKLLANDEFIVARFDDNAASQLIALDAVRGPTVYRRTFPSNVPVFLVNFALADDGTLVWVLPDRIAAKDLFEPGDKLKFGERAARGADQTTFAGAGGDDQLAISSGRILIIGDGGRTVHVASLETGQQLTGDAATPLLLQTGGDATLGTVTQFRNVESNVYITTTISPKLSAYDLERPGRFWDTNQLLNDGKPRDMLIGRNELVLLLEMTPTRGHKPGDFEINAYSRQRTQSGFESGALVHAVSVNEPQGISTIQAVDGGIYYLSGDQKLHYLAGAGGR